MHARFSGLEIWSKKNRRVAVIVLMLFDGYKPGVIQIKPKVSIADAVFAA